MRPLKAGCESYTSHRGARGATLPSPGRTSGAANLILIRWSLVAWELIPAPFVRAYDTGISS